LPLCYLPFLGAARGTRASRPVVASQALSWAPLRESIETTRVALVSSAAVRLAEQPPFTPPEDTTFRAFPIDAPAERLRIDHTSPVGADARVDLEVAVPRAALLALAEQGVVGSVAPRCFAFVGGTVLHEQVEHELAPSLAAELAADRVDLALLAPY
jgi:D-proline reductase (dithiol) PrdB